MQAMSNPPPVISRIEYASTLEKHLPALRDLLQRCVNDEPEVSSIGFLAPLSDADAEAYWKSLSASITGPEPENTLLIATAADQLVATVTIARYLKQTHAYKGEIRKLLVHPDYRRHGLGRAMMDAAERAAVKDLGLELLVLDTATATPAREFYRRTGWTEWGICPDYAMDATRRKNDCSFFVKKL
ncbi:acyl-CoA N-acyltransferase [Xylariaceae sp. FL0255]|nr:acyl-CoA N-acyltransferase [Xylariaceae sp. FL0255]